MHWRAPSPNGMYTNFLSKLLLLENLSGQNSVGFSKYCGSECTTLIGTEMSVPLSIVTPVSGSVYFFTHTLVSAGAGGYILRVSM